MKIILIRHGESTANVKGVLSSSPGDKVTLTERGRSQVHDATRLVRGKINTIYVSPLLRTLETADILSRTLSQSSEVKIDIRISEINYGEYSGKKNNSELDSIRKSQVAGDYIIRFGAGGENKLEILTRLYDFLINVIDAHSSSDRIIVVSHGSITGWLERIILALDEMGSRHRHISNAEIRTYTLRKRDIKKLGRHKMVDEYCAKSRDFSLVSQYRSVFIKLANLYNDIEVGQYVFEQLLTGLFETNITLVRKSIDKKLLHSSEPIAVCVMHNSAIIVGAYIQHYAKLGIKNFVFIDNNSDDASVDVIEHKNLKDVCVDIWHAKDKFDGFKAMGWKQQMFHHYGLNQWYLNLDVDELAVFVDCEKSTFKNLVQYATEHHLKSVGAVLVDMYTNKSIEQKSQYMLEDIISTYQFFDKSSYKYDHDEKFGNRISGGPRTRLFGRHPSLQKFPLAYVDSDTVAINPHFWYPYTVNRQSRRLIGLLHYKFLPGDLEQYSKYIQSGVHWDNSSQYRSYIKYILENPSSSFYDRIYSTKYINSRSLIELVNEDGEKIISSM